MSCNTGGADSRHGFQTAMHQIRQWQYVNAVPSRRALHLVAVVAMLGVTACGGAGAVPTFVPQNSSQVCRTAILEVAAVTIAEPNLNVSGLWCIPIRP